jgi:hypothetical protein
MDARKFFTELKRRNGGSEKRNTCRNGCEGTAGLESPFALMVRYGKH